MIVVRELYGVKFVVAIASEGSAGYSTPFLDLIKDKLYEVLGEADEFYSVKLLVKGEVYKMFLNKRFRHPYKNELKLPVE